MPRLAKTPCKLRSVRSLRRFLLHFAASVAVLSATSGAWGQTEAELVRARKLYSQGLTQEAAGDWTGALGSFEDVARIKVTPQVRFHIARSKEHLGRLNEALGGYRLAEYEAAQGGAKEQEIVDEARKAREALEARIPKLTIERGKGADAIKIELDGVALGDAQIGKEMTVDPGPHVIVGVMSPGKSFQKKVNVSEGDAVKVTLDAPEEPSVAPSPEPAKPTPEPTPLPDQPAPPPAEHTSYAVPIVLGGVGLAAIAVSFFSYQKASDAKKELDAGCIGRKCPDTLRDTQSRGETYTAVGGISLGLGVASLVAGAVVALGSKSSTEPKPAAALHVDPRTRSLSFSGSF